MEDFLNQGWFALQIAWYTVAFELSTHIIAVVAAVTILLLLWIFLSPLVKNRNG